MRILTLDAALDGCSAGLVHDGVVVAEVRRTGQRGSAAVLPALANQVLAGAAFDTIAVTVGPGSFTGVRAALALAHGIGLGAGVAVRGVSVGDAMRAAVLPPGARAVWVAVDNRRGRVFLDGGGLVSAVALDALPAPDGPVAVAGDAAIAVASRWAARGFDVQLLPGRWPGAAGIAAAAWRAARPALPLYVDAPEARPNAAARPAPAG